MYQGRQIMKNILLLKGDGIGPEIAAQAVKALSLFCLLYTSDAADD